MMDVLKYELTDSEIDNVSGGDGKLAAQTAKVIVVAAAALVVYTQAPTARPVIAAAVEAVLREYQR